ncbi:uncharacterized protein KRP23_14174 [Phytophthora ramorum]|uniref:uncharacterized protein n=1 Tax=Phytophthora ramorum TaxID=164328 RepID=UPI0030AFEDBC|nr:hypothetical protein KRP23_14174 [Phytophthora ramorum]
MQALPVGSSRMAPLLQAASLPSEPYSAPHTIRTIRLPSLAPRLPALPSLMSTLAAQGGYPSSATTSPSRTQSSSISFLLNPPARQVSNAPHQLNHIHHQQQQYAPVASAATAPSSIMYHPYANSPSSMPMPTSMLQPQETKPQPKKKRKTRICKSEGCENGASIKGSLGFIMNAADVASASETPCANPATPAKVSVKHCKTKVRRTLSYEEKRRLRECKADGCENYIINKGLCFRHGGGKKCSVEGCQSSAKNAGLCWRHGTTRP